jgi:hypothetical protein
MSRLAAFASLSRFGWKNPMGNCGNIREESGIILGLLCVFLDGKNSFSSKPVPMD